MIAPLLLLSCAFGPFDEPKKPVDDFKPEPGWKDISKGAKTVWFDPKERKLILRARVVLQKGALEFLMCKTNSKEHESILATDAQPKLIHAGLILTGAEPGRPVRFQPKFSPPTGSKIDIELEWKDAEGKLRRAKARDWVKQARSGQPLNVDWVFAGSFEGQDPETKERYYAADSGDLISVSNFPSAILDLPFSSSADNADLVFIADSDAVPPVGTDVLAILKPVKHAKK